MRSSEASAFTGPRERDFPQRRPAPCTDIFPLGAGNAPPPRPRNRAEQRRAAARPAPRAPDTPHRTRSPGCRAPDGLPATRAARVRPLVAAGKESGEQLPLARTPPGSHSRARRRGREPALQRRALRSWIRGSAPLRRYSECVSARCRKKQPRRRHRAPPRAPGSPGRAGRACSRCRSAHAARTLPKRGVTRTTRRSLRAVVPPAERRVRAAPRPARQPKPPSALDTPPSRSLHNRARGQARSEPIRSANARAPWTSHNKIDDPLGAAHCRAKGTPRPGPG